MGSSVYNAASLEKPETMQGNVQKTASRKRLSNFTLLGPNLFLTPLVPCSSSLSCASNRRDRDGLTSALIRISFTLFSVVQGFLITTPSGWSNSQTVTMTWTSNSADPDSFSVELINPTLLNNQPFAIATTLKKTDGSYSFRLPLVPSG